MVFYFWDQKVFREFIVKIIFFFIGDKIYLKCMGELVFNEIGLYEKICLMLIDLLLIKF